ncbi:MAG: prepilin-type N-terminal cleavage/methylation domain-containing protein [Candidatus Rokubacteria bacterium]|nr:prepilin-type N-terminal cleavage/methylation domain-containing protein [Candidatus Rokubacteria bacterium]MBI3825556.1 prepilin-type N-terminal cleavage/methylation domain-containing protein [Candidatus Rokubacteria bacterium]
MSQRGFSLVELLIGCTVAAVVLAGVFAVVSQGMISIGVGDARVAVQQNARTTLARIAAEMLGAQPDASGAIFTAGANCDQPGGANDVTFNACTVGGWDANTGKCTTPQTVRYAVSGTNLQRTASLENSGVAVTLVGGVQAFAVQCWDRTDSTRTPVQTTYDKAFAVTISLTTQNEDNPSSSNPQYQLVTNKTRLLLRSRTVYDCTTC